MDGIVHLIFSKAWLILGLYQKTQDPLEKLHVDRKRSMARPICHVCMKFGSLQKKERIKIKGHSNYAKLALCNKVSGHSMVTVLYNGKNG